MRRRDFALLAPTIGRPDSWTRSDVAVSAREGQGQKVVVQEFGLSVGWQRSKFIPTPFEPPWQATEDGLSSDGLNGVEWIGEELRPP